MQILISMVPWLLCIYNMAASPASLPVWLLNGKEEITNSKEWDNFLQDLYDVIQQQLRESHVQSFSDLSTTEQNLFVEKATRALNGGPTYAELFNRVSKSLDRQLNNDVSRQLLQDSPVNTKTDLVVGNTQDGIVCLLQKWPKLRSKLTACFNQPLSDLVRPVAWKAFLENSKVRKQYVQTLAANPRSAVSPLDREISKTVEHLISTEPVLEDFRGSIGAFYAMKAVLSYYHAVGHTAGTMLPDAYFYISIPLVLLESPNFSRKEPAPSRVVALLTEEYFTLVSSLPRFVKELMNEGPEEQVKTFTSHVAENVFKMHKDLAIFIIDVYVPGSENIVATEAGNRSVLADAVRALIKPVIKNLFVGYVNKDVLFFIWDQYIIGLDSPGFCDEYLPAVAAIFLTLLGDRLKAAGSPARMESCLKVDGRKLTVAQFQYELNKHFYRDLLSRLHHDNRPVLPVLDPTQAVLPPWFNWFAPSQIPNHLTSDERRRVRDEREAERMRLLQLKRNDLERQRKEEEEQLMRQQAQLHQEDRNVLEEELEKEQRRRREMERSAAEEIERLRQEIEELRRAQLRPGTRDSLASAISHYLIPPPPSFAALSKPTTPFQENLEPVRNTTPKSPARQDHPKQSETTQTSTAILDFLTKVSHGFHRVANGEGYQRLDLDKASKEAIITHRNDLKEAEIEVFGHELGPGDFERLPRETKEAKSQEIMNVIRRQITERRREHLRNGVRR